MDATKELFRRTLAKLKGELSAGQESSQLPQPDAGIGQSRKTLRPSKPESEPVREDLRPGVWVEFFSPLFGQCTAKIHDVTLTGAIITDHSVLKGEGEPVTIPASWVRGVYKEG